MGIYANVYKNQSGYDCSLNGISSDAQELLILNAEGPFEEKQVQAVMARSGRKIAVARMVPGNLPGCVKIVPVDEAGEPVKQWVMFGGNFAYSSDSRFHELVAALGGPRHGGAVPIHDRIEG